MTAKLKELETLKGIFWSLSACVCIVALAYTFLVNMAVHNVAEREEMENAITKLHSELGELEFKYISMKNSINPELAYSLGFRDVKNEQFISRTRELSGLSMKTIQ